MSIPKFINLLTTKLPGAKQQHVLEVPGNCSRLFRSREEAETQPTAHFKFALDVRKGYISNSLFNPRVISYDLNYYTGNQPHLAESQSILAQLIAQQPKIFELPIVDIGCGQGEIVNYLRTLGIQAKGFDPVLRETNEFLHNTLYSPSVEGNEQPALYIFRCVIPHVENPWKFLSEFLNENSYAYVEFQDFNWTLKNKAWQQISHDHVNMFTKNDFASEYNVIASGEFLKEEWSWVLIKKSEKVNRRPRKIEIDPYKQEEIQSLLAQRHTDISLIGRMKKRVVIYGAAGKGINLAFALKSNGVTSIVATDQDGQRWGRYMECSGVPVVSPEVVKSTISSQNLVISANPNHFHTARAEFGDTPTYFSLGIEE